MSYQVKTNDLQYQYTWTRDKGDALYSGKLDQIKIDKNEGYEILYFIQSFMNEFNLRKLQDVHRIENLIHKSDKVMRNDIHSFVVANWNNLMI